MSFTPWKQLPDRMKLLILSTEFPPGPGGIGTHAYELASGLQSLGWQVAVIAPQDYVTKAERVMFNEQLPFAVNTLANGSVARRLRQIWKTLRQTRPDLLIATGSRSLWAAMLLCPLLGIPWLAIGHGTEFKKSGRLVRFLTRQAVRRADEMVAVSRYTARLVADERPNPIPVIPNGADAKRFRPDLPTAPLRHELGLDGRQILLTVGHVSERKAQDIVIRALPAVLTQCPDAVYLIAGLPTRQAALQKLATELHVAEHVIFAGMVPPEQLPT
ncbi:MAG: glycosyltransferase family 4 protein, partial [Anaerolineales bacterium]|nr:glycosyltransferase family 4 protein [Anaerolineales bacterium]